jgi:hypothetical protein
MNLLDELKGVIQIRINDKALAGKIFDLGVMRVLEKLVEVIPTDIDNALLEKYKEELKSEFIEALEAGTDKLEEITGLELDGEE